jgi:hypothetical protein
MNFDCQTITELLDEADKPLGGSNRNNLFNKIHEMINTNAGAPVKCKKSIQINAESKKVWSVLTDINNWPGWQKDISNSNLKGELKAGTGFIWRSGGVKIHSSLHTVEPFKKFGWTGKAPGTLAIHNWTLTEHEGKTDVVADESMEGMVPKFFKKSFSKNLEKGMQSWLELLKKECEKN